MRSRYPMRGWPVLVMRGWPVLVGALTGVACDAPEVHDPGPAPVVESLRPSAGDLALADSATLTIGEPGLSDDPAYAFFDIRGGAFLPGGDIVVGVSGTYEVRRYDRSGNHMWTSGREGDGPGEFRSSRVLRGCTGDTIRVFDVQLDRISELDDSGNFIRTWQVGTGTGGRAPNYLMCGAGGQVAFTTWGAIRRDVTEGQHYRSPVALYWQPSDGTPTLVRDDVPGPERTQLSRSVGPRTWGKKPIFAATDSGVWLGDADEFELHFFDWHGSPAARTIRWVGPELGVNQTDVDALRRSQERWFGVTGDERARANFERRWPQMRASLPSRFPAVSRVLVLNDGTLWVEVFPRPSQVREWHVFDPDGSWLHRVSIPYHVELLDVSTDAVLAKVWDADGVERLEVRTLRAGAGAG